MKYKERKEQIFQTLKSLGNATGFQIAKHIKEQTTSRFMIGYGTLYRALYDLEKEGKIIAWWDNGKRYYKLA